MRVLIVGCGYVGSALAEHLDSLGHEVWGLRRTLEGDEAHRSQAIHWLMADVTQPASLRPTNAHFDWVINALSSSGGGSEAYEAVYLKGTQNLMEWLDPTRLQRYVHISSTSVYGQTDGSEVTETSPTRPDAPTSQILVSTEQLLLTAWNSRRWPTLILRSSGIYGPNRGRLFQQYLRGEGRLIGEGKRWLNMVHRDDLVGMISVSLRHGKLGEIYNASDCEPVAEIDFFRWLATKLNRVVPGVAEPSTHLRKRGTTNKRVSNLKIRNELGYQLRYPSFREGYSQEIRDIQK